MTTNTEALRAQFEQYVNPDGDVNMHWLAAGYYAGRGVQQSWLDFQAGHAAAKAETAAAVAAERERCLRIVQSVDNYSNPMTANDCAAAIRAGAKEPSDG